MTGTNLPPTLTVVRSIRLVDCVVIFAILAFSLSEKSPVRMSVKERSGVT